jgi:ATP-binding cassette subfamily A (ABC1) protein 3
MYESILRTALDDPEFEFQVSSRAYPTTYEVMQMIKAPKSGSIVFFTAIAYSIVLTNIVSYLVNERVSNLKHVQQISGMKLSAYWIGNFLFDLSKMSVTIFVTIATNYIMDIGLQSSLIMFALFPFAVLPFSYCLSFVFTADSAAQTFTMFFNLTTIMVLSTMVYAFRVMRKLELWGDELNLALRVIPSYMLADSVYFDETGQFLADFRNRKKGLKGTINPDPYYWKNNTADFVLSVFHFFFWTFVLILIESDVARTWWQRYSQKTEDLPPKNEGIVLDDDVTAEANRVKNGTTQGVKIRVNELRKVYMTSTGPCSDKKPLVAVENLSFSVSAGECFALLGVNGAGKSTTFKSLTSEVQPSSGIIEINGVDITKNFSQVRKYIGYCP